MQRWLLLVIALLFVASSSFAQGRRQGKQQGKGEPFTLEDPRFAGIHYWLQVPEGRRGESFPLLFALHGNGQDARGHFRRMCQVSTKEQPVIVVAPWYQTEKRFGAPVHKQALPAFERILAKVCEEHPVDRSRMVLQGFSMGCIYSCRWAYEKGPEGFPFAALFLNSSVMPPRGPAPKVPYLMWVGTKERKVAGRYDVLQSVRQVFGLMLAQGYDAWYLQMEDKGHTVAPESLELQRSFLATMPSYAGLAQLRGKVPEELVPVLERLHSGKLDGVLAEIAELAKGGKDSSLSSRSAARRLHRTLPKSFEKLAKDWSRHAPEAHGLMRYEALLRLEAALAQEPKLQAKIAAVRNKLEKSKSFAAELEARDAYQAAVAKLKDDAAAAKAELQTLAEGDLAKTEFGQRATQTLVGLEPPK
jgi:predicted esterase